MAYASRLSANPYQTYRQIDVVGRTAVADGPALVQLMYEELIAALRAVAWAVTHRQYAVKGERLTRATAILFALEAGIDHERGGDVATALAHLYAATRRQIVEAAIGTDPAPFTDAAQTLSEIADAWKQAKAA